MVAQTDTAIRVGVSPPRRFEDVALDERRHDMDAIAAAGLDHVFFADHVSFKTGMGMDGMIQAAALSQLQGDLSIYVGVYLLALRHPVTVARQLATFSEFAPGRLVFGVGVGGEDRHEMEVCGIDPATRGRRTDECLEIIRGLLSGQPIDYHGDFYQLEAAQILPAPDPTPTITIGGRSDAALRRTGRYGDGWIAAWCTADRVAESIDRIGHYATEAGRSVQFDHGLQLWCAVGETAEAARPWVARRMERFYQLPFERFERHAPVGRPEDIAAFLAPFFDAGCRHFNLTVCAESVDEAIEGAGQVKRLLAG